MEAQAQGQQAMDEMEDEQFRQALSRSVVDVTYDPTELPNTVDPHHHQYQVKVRGRARNKRRRTQLQL